MEDAVDAPIGDIEKIQEEVEGWRNDVGRDQKFVNPAIEHWRKFLAAFKRTDIKDFNYVWSQSMTQHYLELMDYLSTATLTGVPSEEIYRWITWDSPPFGVRYVKNKIALYRSGN